MTQYIKIRYPDEFIENYKCTLCNTKQIKSPEIHNNSLEHGKRYTKYIMSLKNDETYIVNINLQIK